MQSQQKWCQFYFLSFKKNEPIFVQPPNGHNIAISCTQNDLRVDLRHIFTLFSNYCCLLEWSVLAHALASVQFCYRRGCLLGSRSFRIWQEIGWIAIIVG